MRIGEIFRYPYEKIREEELDGEYTGAIQYKDPEQILYDL